MRITIPRILVVLIAIYLAIMLYHTRGPTIRIETSEPTQDYVVRCIWTSDLLTLHGGAELIAEHVDVIESDENYFCGVSLRAAIMNGRGGASILHPLYTRMQGVDENGVSVIHPASKLTILDELNAEFEAGKWDKHKWPGSEYAESVRNVCGFGNQYFDYYGSAQKIDIEHFKRLYDKPIVECLDRVFTIIDKYQPNSYPGKRPTAREWMDKLWRSEKWKKYQ